MTTLYKMKVIPLNPMPDGTSRTMKEKTGGVRLASMIHKVEKPYLWIDTYNQCVNEIAGTIKACIDHNSMYYVSVEK